MRGSRHKAGLLAAVAVVVAGYRLVVRGRQLGWGSTEDEARGPQPGDELLDRPDLVATRAITIDAPAEWVWPWIAQLGQGSGGGTRLIVRERYAYTRWWAPLLIEPVAALAFVMTRKMLRGIKRRAEQEPRRWTRERVEATG